MKYNTIDRVVGGSESQVVVGNVAFDVQNNLAAYAITCRVTGTIIAAITVRDNDGNDRAYAPTWLGIELNQNDYFVSLFPIVQITLTAATDSIVLHCDNPY